MATRAERTTTDVDQVRRAIGHFGRAFAAPAVDVDELRRLWDKEYPDPVYQPEELPEPLRSWAEIDDYFGKLPERIDGVSHVRPLDFRVDAVGDLAYAYARASARLGVRHREETLDGEVRQTFVLRRRDGHWLLIHYHESRLTPGLEDVVA
jgi:ketosteroid isomerase-like protein